MNKDQEIKILKPFNMPFEQLWGKSQYNLISTKHERDVINKYKLVMVSLNSIPLQFHPKFAPSFQLSMMFQEKIMIDCFCHSVFLLTSTYKCGKLLQ